MTGEITRLVLAGRGFWPATPATNEHMDFIEAQLLGGGVLGEATINEMVAGVLEAGRASRLFAGLYTEEGVDGEGRPWDRKAALKLATALQNSPPSDRGPLKTGLYLGLARFFGVAPDSSTSSPSSSETTDGAAPDAPPLNDPEVSG